MVRISNADKECNYFFWRRQSSFIHLGGSGCCSGCLPNFAHPTRLANMSTMNIFLPDVLKEFVDRQASMAGYGTSSEYVRELIRRDQERTQLRNLLLEGAQSKPSGLADAGYFASLRSGIKKRLTKTR